VAGGLGVVAAGLLVYQAVGFFGGGDGEVMHYRCERGHVFEMTRDEFLQWQDENWGQPIRCPEHDTPKTYQVVKNDAGEWAPKGQLPRWAREE